MTRIRRQPLATHAPSLAAENPATWNEEALQTTRKDASYRTGFPKEDGQSLSYWLQGVRCDPLLDHRSTADLPANADTVIIGSGIAGTLTAKTYLETFPDKSVVVLEAREFCSGATGRNAGHCKPDRWRGFAQYAEAFGSDQALKMLRNEQDTWKALVSYVHENNVDCDLWVGDTLDVAMTPQVAQLAAADFESFKRAGGDADLIKFSHGEDAVRISRLKGAQSCYASPASTLQPWKLTAHIMRSSLKRIGTRLNLQTYTRVNAVLPSTTETGKWLIQTDRGTITTSTVIHATNAYCAALLHSMRGLVRPSPHLCNKVIPPRTFSGSGALQHSYGVLLPGGALISINSRCTSDGLVMFGGVNPEQHMLDKWLAAHPEQGINDGLGTGGLTGTTASQSVTAAVKEFAEEQFEGWKEGAEKAGPGSLYDYQWSGIIGASADGVPWVGALPGLEGQWICAGFHGHGMARAFTAASGLVKLMEGKGWEETGLPDVFQITEERMERLRK